MVLGAAGVNAQGTQWYSEQVAHFLMMVLKSVIGAGLPDDSHAMAAQKSNLYFGTGLLSDMNEVKLLDMADLDGSQNVRVVMRFTPLVYKYGITFRYRSYITPKIN